MSKNKPSRRHRGRDGFTLLEVLVAAAMFAVIVGALYSVFYGALRLRENSYLAFEKNLPKDYVVEIIKRDLANVATPAGILAGAMIGEKEEQGELRFDRLEIHTASGMVNDTEPWGDIQKIEYSLEQPAERREDREERATPESYDLVRAVTRNLLASTTEEPETQRLLQGVQSLAFRYYDGQDWQDSWDSTTRENETPLAVEVYILFLPAERQADSAERETLPIELVVPIVTKAAATEQQEGGEGSGQPPSGGQPNNAQGSGGRT